MFIVYMVRSVVLPLIAAALSLVLAGSGGAAPEPEPDSEPPTPEVFEPAAWPGDECAEYVLTELEGDAIRRGELILVNHETPYQFPEQQELANVYAGKSGSYFVRDMDVALAPAALGAINAMLDDFLAQGGSKSVNLVAGYRTVETQQRLFDQSAARNGLAHAKRYVALPGHSEHHTGLAADFSIYHSDGTSSDFDGAGEFGWIVGNCHRYGLIVRYDEDKEPLTGIAYEPWHFRYVGVPHATKMAQLGLCLEEYIDYLRAFPFDGQHLIIDCADGRYEAWFEEGGAAHLPREGEFYVSGNNVDGVIVTRKLPDEA